MSAQPTPGPWTNDDGLVCGFDSRGRFAGMSSIDIFDASKWPTELAEEAQANARLIVAAPDLLAALIAVCSDEPWQNTPHTLLAQARAAIAKAEGRTP